MNNSSFDLFAKKILPGKKPVASQKHFSLAPKVSVATVTQKTFPAPFTRKTSKGAHALPIIIIIFLMLVSFGSGMWVLRHSEPSSAQDEFSSPTVAGSIHMADGMVNLGPIESIPNEVLFNLNLDLLEKYLDSLAKEPQLKAELALQERTEKLKKYLLEKKSPFASIASDIAKLKHWKLVLAISFAESSLGKRCKDNNCSGIGVAPEHPLWRKYETTAAWAADLDKLLEKRYQNWSLEKMNGVYNQPGSANWLAATRQVLTELAEQGIE